MPSLVNTVRDLDRLRQIVVVLVKHGFGEVVRRAGLATLVGGKTETSTPPPARATVGERIRLAVTELGPSFIKLAQVVSTRPDLVPDDIVRELKTLQDAVPGLPFSELREHVERELGASIAEIYETFEETPLASASIAQVHRARLRTADGPREVVVKIQRPNIQNTIARDMDLLYWLAKAIERSIPESHIYAPSKLVAEFDRAIQSELDFTMEAEHAERFAKNFQGDPIVKFPKVYRDATSRRVLTLEFIDGKKVYAAVASGASGEKIAKRSIALLVKQIFEDGFFHADPHPGNVLIGGSTDEPVIGLIDLGLVGRLTPHLRDRTIDLMVAAVQNDYRGMADALYAIGSPTRKIDRNAFEAEVALLADRYLGRRLADFELSALIRDLIGGATKFGLEVPPDFLMVGIALMTVEGIGKEIYPELDAFTEVKPYFLELLKRRYAPERVTADVMRGVIRLSAAASDMPLQMQEILEDLRKGSLSIRVRDHETRAAADVLGRRVFSGMVVSSCLLSGSLLIANQYGGLGVFLLFIGVVWTVVHAFSSWRRVRKSGSQT